MTEQHFPTQRVVYGAVFLVIIASLLKLASVFWGQIHPDTNYYLNIATNYLEHGGLTPYMWRIPQDANIVAGSGTGYGVLLMVWWLQITGVSTISANTLSYLAGVLSLVLLFFSVRRWYDTPTALFAVVFLAISTHFFRSANGRMDSLAMLAYTALLFLHRIALERRNPWLHFLLGLLVIATVEVHMLALIYVGAFSFYYGISHLQKIHAERRLLVYSPVFPFGVGLVIASAIYVVVRILPNPEHYFLISTTCSICTSPGPFSEMLRYFAYFVQAPLDFVLIVAGVIAALYRRLPADRYFLLLVGGSVLAVAIFSPPPWFIQYFGHTTPIFAIGIGALFARGIRVQTEFESRRLITAFLLCTVILIFNTVRMTAWYAPLPVDERVTYVREHVPYTTVLTSGSRFFYLFTEYTNFLSYKDGEEFALRILNQDYPTFWDHQRPEAIIEGVDPLRQVPDLWNYIQRSGFREVMPGLWLNLPTYASAELDHPGPEVRFTADRYEISRGECTLLSWDITGADQIIFEGETVDQTDTKEVCPDSTIVYTLDLLWYDQQDQLRITVEVFP